MIRADLWSPADGLTLEPNALLAATETVRNLALTAGPGAGKTEMLAQRADFLLRTGTSRYPKRILAISFKVDASQNLKARVRKRCGPALAMRLDSHTFHAFAKRVIDRFRPVLTGADALDSDYSVGPHRIQGRAITYDDMVPLALQIVQSSRIVRRAIRHTYSDVFLDEFQDCTNLQYKLIKACFQGAKVRLTAVGDTKQRIMGWAGALEGIFDDYAEDFGAHALNLYQNFRSDPVLRRMQNSMVRIMDPVAALDDNDVSGDAGEIEVLRYDNDSEEARGIADLISKWINDDGVNPSEVAVLVSKQQNIYGRKLRAALEERCVPYRDEDATQNLASEPIANLIVDFLLIVTGQRQPGPFQRLLDLVIFGRGFDQENEYRARSQWSRFVEAVKQRVAEGEVDLAELDDLRGIVDELVHSVGRDRVVSLSPDYMQGTYLQQQIIATIDRVHMLLSRGDLPAIALASFSGDRSVKIMSIHKSKGLEFDTVVILGVEAQTFWGEESAERSAFFVGISRAKRRLYLTVCEERERPGGVRRWDVARTGHEEFLGYAMPYL